MAWQHGRRDAKPAAAPAPRETKAVAAPGLPRYLQGGAALPDAARTRLEAGFGAPLGHLRLHTDAQAARMSERIDAEAFTLGHHIFLAADQPATRIDLLAHEVAHALQQSGADLASGAARSSRPGDAAERAAERASRDVMQGRRAARGPSTAAQVAREPRDGSGISPSEEDLEDLAAIGEAPSPFIRLLNSPPYEVQQRRYERGVARQAEREQSHEQSARIEETLWKAQVEADALKARTGIDGHSGLMGWGIGGGRILQSAIREGGDDIEKWLEETQIKGTRQAYAEADAHADDWYGPLLRANAVVNDMTSEFSTGVARGGVTLGSGLLGAMANPYDTVGGALNLGNDLINPFADKKELNSAVDAIADPYVNAVGKGRYLEAGGRLFFDIAALLVGGSEANAATKGTGVATKGTGVAAKSTRVATQWTPELASQVAQNMKRRIAWSPAAETGFRTAAAEIADSMRASGLAAEAEQFLKEADVAILDGLKAHEKKMREGGGYGGRYRDKVEVVEQPGATPQGLPRKIDLSEKRTGPGGSLSRDEYL